MSRSSEVKVTVGTTSTPLIGGSERRKSITFSPDVTTRYTVSTVEPAVLGQGVNIHVGQVPVTLTREQHGEAVSRAWFGISNAAPVAIGILEVQE